MRARIEALGDQEGRARAIREIPHIEVCLIEGRNGIGKTLAIRLLQLLSGRQPFTDASSWESLRAELGPLEIQIDELRSSRTVSARLDPAGWPDTPDRVGSWLGEVWIDGEEASPAEVGEMLEISRFGGNEDLTTVTKQEVGREHARLTEVQRLVSARIDELDERCAEAVDLLAWAAPAERSRRQENLERTEAALEKARAPLDALLARNEALGRAQSLQADLKAKKEVSADDSTRLASLEQKTRVAEARRKELDRELEDLLQRLGKRGDAEAELKKAEGSLRRRQSTAAKRKTAAQELAAGLGLDQSGDLASEAERLRGEERSAVGELEARRQSLGAGARTLTVIDELALPLETLIAEGFGESPVVLLNEKPISAGALLGGVRAQERMLTNAKAPAVGVELDREIKARAERISALGDLLKKARQAESSGEKVAESEQKVEQARKSLDASDQDVESYDRLTTERSKADAEMKEAVRREVELRQSLGLAGAGSRTDLEADLEQVLGEVNVDAARLQDALVESEVAIKSARADLAAAESAHQLAQRESDRAAGSAKYALRRLRDDEALAPFLHALEKIGAGSADEDLSELWCRVEHLSERLTLARETLEGVTAMMGAIAEGGQHWPRDTGARLPFARLLSRVLDERLRERLDSDEINAALFEGHSPSGVDIEHGTVTWSENGSSVTRSLSSFSTGEQAFAFTQARVLALDPLSGHKDRLVVLDEFGAFVSADRLATLAEFLKDAAVTERASQILVVLPLQANYEGELEETTGTLYQRYAQKVAQLRDRGYVADEFADQVSLLSG